MTFNIIGTGNTAWFIGTKLVEAGHTCTGIYGRNPERTALIAGALQTKVYSSLSEMPDTSDCCVIAISDYAINEVAAQLQFSQSTLIHTAGAVDISVLEPQATNAGVIWPVYSILKDDLPKHRSIPLVWEGNTDIARTLIQSIVNGISDIAYETDSEQRKWLHLTAVLGNNFTNHLLSICEQLCRLHNMPFELLYPIISQTANRVLFQSPTELQTGPARRNDINTMENQTNMLASNPNWQSVYKALSASIENMYNANAAEKGAKR